MADKRPETVNSGYVDFGRIDLLVDDGFYHNRGDFIRSAILNQLGSHTNEVARSIERQTLEFGLREPFLR